MQIDDGTLMGFAFYIQLKYIYVSHIVSVCVCARMCVCVFYIELVSSCAVSDEINDEFKYCIFICELKSITIANRP